MMKKKMIALLAAMGVMMAPVLSTEAAWNVDGTGWWYTHEDGGYAAVSYTHLDVYKRQQFTRDLMEKQNGAIQNVYRCEILIFRIWSFRIYLKQ